VLAHRLADRGPPALLSWERHYPQRWCKGTARVPTDSPEMEPFARTTYPLRWDRPQSWLRTGWSVRDAEVLVLAVVTPFHAVPYAGPFLGSGRAPTKDAVVHNVLAHESSAINWTLMGALPMSMDQVVVHSHAQADLAGDLEVAAEKLRVAELAAHFPSGTGAGGDVGAAEEPPVGTSSGTDEVRLLFLDLWSAYLHAVLG